MGIETLKERVSEREVAEQVCSILSGKLPDYRDDRTKSALSDHDRYRGKGQS